MCGLRFGSLEEQLESLTSHEPFQQVLWKLRRASALIPGLNTWIHDVKGSYDVTLRQIRRSVNESEIAMEQVWRAIKDHGKELTKVLDSIRNFTVTLQQQLTDIFLKEDHSQRVSSILGFAIIIPITLVILSILGLTAISVSWAFYTSRDRHDGRQSRRGAVSAVAASILATAGYSAMLVGALLCIMSAVCFVAAFLGMFVCTGLFEDSELRLFQAIPNMEYVINIGSVKVRHTLYDTFYKCKNGYTFFESLKGSQIMAEKEFRNVGHINFAFQISEISRFA
ncbi:Tat pathway signal sequence domain protein [Ancylostoma caninum]|uniref:Tat pathway signal sequence domain protein n=1 Tax=Ancylostoma caninum TaxID=29170 RepID=A0A368H2W0_ANCCA|nr:Tat pathway signal sequence domain protein [Ancylostoma caninum]